MAYTPLYSYEADTPVLLGGTHTQFSADSGSTWKALKGCQELGDIGDIAESVECTTIDDDRKMYTSGLKDSADKELTMFFYDGDEDQAALITAAQAHSEVTFKHQWPNGTIATYSLRLMGYQIVSGTADGFMQLKVSGKQSTDVSWSTASVVSSGTSGGGGNNTGGTTG